METLTSLLIIFLFLFAGMAGARFKLIPQTGYLDRIMSTALALLLFSMGLRIGMLESITQQLMRIGLLSLSFAVATVLGTLVLLLALMAITGKLGSTAGSRSTSSEPSAGPEKPGITPAAERTAEPAVDGRSSEPAAQEAVPPAFGLSEPFRLFLLVVAGFLSGYFVPLFGWFREEYTTYLLYALLFLIGVQMVRNEVDLKRAMLHPATFLVPLLTMLGSLGGGLALAGAFELPAGKALSLAAGFGWYSLSGVLISEMGDPVLGAAGFLINVIREVIALLAIPFLARLNMPMAAIGVGGATSMDVTLPLIERSCGPGYVPLSIVNGALLSMLVPLLVPFFYSLG
ncbi:MAG: lysine exporter LysO family protein [Spirochaetaceae bacterium]|nr:lysine exporter LysO family protein [Spirochaetaceae bacterium]MCF7947736.1 lysine exporter LysO family protein [Spirochaetia bacterium]MCF7951228.1 lysine exporter LysO family protein [Spirochaetaceae bacterium]